MDLLASSCHSVSAAAVGKAIGIWAAQWLFGGASMVAFSCRNPEEDSAPTGKLPGVRTKNRPVWSSVEINVG